MKTTRSTRIRQKVGVTLMVAALGVAGSVLSLAPAGAEDGEPETVQLEVVKTAYYSTSLGRGAPNTVTSEFPPGVACIVRPELCPEEGAEIFGAIGEQIGQVEDLPTGPAMQVQPGTLPVGTHQGETAYRSALLTTLPAVPAGQELGRFVLRLAQDPSQSFHTSSPMFRQAVLTALASYQSGGFNQEEFNKALAADPVSQQITGVEACPIVTAFEGEPNQGEDAAPEIDCLFGTNGVFLEGEDVWEFDLTFAASAWAEGRLENLGVFLRPTAAPNLAYGDKDFTSSSRVVFVPTESVDAAVVTEPESQPPAPFTPAPSNNTSPTFSSPSSSGGIAPSPIFQPEVAPEPAPEAAPAPATETVASVPFIPSGEAETPWWLWLLVPIFLAGMYLTSQSLTEEVVLASGQREGAMSRLLDLQSGSDTAAAGPAGPRRGAMSRLTAL